MYNIYIYICIYVDLYPYASIRLIEPLNGGGRGGSTDRLHKAPTDYTKPQQTIQITEKTMKIPGRLYKATERLCNAPTYYTKT